MAFPFSMFAAPDYSMRDHRIFGESLQFYYQELFEENFSKYEKMIEQAKSREDALKIVEAAKARVKKTWKFPQKKSPLIRLCPAGLFCGEYLAVEQSS